MPARADRRDLDAAVLVLVVAGGMLASIAGPPKSAFNGQFVIDSYAIFAKFVVLAGSALAIVMSHTTWST